MSATVAQIARVRRMTGLMGSSDYSDEDIQEVIERHPLLDENGVAPYYYDTSTTPPTKTDNSTWVATYDLYAAAADIWEERATALAGDYDFSADGASYTRSQAYEQFMKQARHYRARRAPATWKAAQWPSEAEEDPSTYVFNG